MNKLILSSSNVHKIEEIKSILEALEFEIISKNDIGLEALEVEEDGDTLVENALKKAREIAQKVTGIVIADDTGLFVDYLDGRPGVYSARYAGEDCSYKENNKKLLRELDQVDMEKRTARFKTVIAIIYENGDEEVVEGVCEGVILTKGQGAAGFGYDPLFKPNGYDKTFAELGSDVKNKISHRARALVKLKETLTNYLENK